MDKKISDDETRPSPTTQSTANTTTITTTKTLTSAEKSNTSSSSSLSSATKLAELRERLMTFDRLVPRGLYKRKWGSGEAAEEPNPDSSSSPSSSGSSQAKRERKSAKKEYSKLKHLVPGLNDREDLSKVEIIEETIRYIDALHSQLASRMGPTTSSGLELDYSSTDAATSDTAPESSSTSTTTAPVTPLHPVQTEVSVMSSPTAATTTASISSTSGATMSSTSEESPTEVKAAVENIQALFALFLEQQQQS